jgi:hypothetical protein
VIESKRLFGFLVDFLLSKSLISLQMFVKPLIAGPEFAATVQKSAIKWCKLPETPCEGRSRPK